MNNYIQSFLNGMARVLDIGSTLNRPRRFKYLDKLRRRRPLTDKEARELDTKALAQDWSRVLDLPSSKEKSDRHAQ